MLKNGNKVFDFGNFFDLERLVIRGLPGGEVGFEILKEPNFIITIKYEIPTLSSVGPFFEEGGEGSRKFRPEAEIFWIFSIEVAPYLIRDTNKKMLKTLYFV